MAAFATPVPLSNVGHSCVKHRRSVPQCRSRRPRRGALPPVVPSTIFDQHRAIELLGNYTQRRPSTELIAQLTTLIGGAPPTREVASSWKHGLQFLNRSPHAPPNPSKQTRELSARVRLPEGDGLKSDRRLGYTFSLLDRARRRLGGHKPLADGTKEELARLTGIVPTTEKEIRVIARTLAALSYKRRKSERVPPRYPTCRNDLQQVSMLLGLFERRDKIGKQTDKLRSLIGGVPRTRNVARSWKKSVDARRVRLARQEKATIRRAVADEKRRQRKARREQPEWVRGISRIGYGLRKWLGNVLGPRK